MSPGAKWLPCANPACGALDPGAAEAGDVAGKLRTTFKLCGKCKTAAFCSNACLKACWDMHHKPLCDAFRPCVTAIPSSKNAMVCMERMQGF